MGTVRKHETQRTKKAVLLKDKKKKKKDKGVIATFRKAVHC
jgi:hypothetical protein